MTAMPAIPINIRFILPAPLIPLPDHLLFGGRKRRVQRVDRLAYFPRDEQLRPPRLRHEAARRRMVEEAEQPVPEAADVQQAERFAVIAKRVPRPCLEQFVERTDAPG